MSSGVLHRHFCQTCVSRILFVNNLKSNNMSMSKTKDEILEQMRIEMPFHLPDRIRPYIEEAMQIYADQEARAFANWLSNTVIAGRTMDKLFKDYKAEIGDAV